MEKRPVFVLFCGTSADIFLLILKVCGEASRSPPRLTKDGATERI
ncbi:MAG: hypothetical protein V2A63_03755 [Patescibacteria group bacterium]